MATLLEPWLVKHPPEWLRPIWSFLSDMTSWFNWDALAAIGTVGALWFVIIQSTRAGRAGRAKAIGILTFLIGLVEAIEAVPIYDDSTDDDFRETSGGQIEIGLSIVRRAIAGIQTLSLNDAAAVGVVEWIMALPLALGDIETTLRNRRIEPASNVHSSIRYVWEATLHFRYERDKLLHGPLVRWTRTGARAVARLFRRRSAVKIIAFEHDAATRPSTEV
ncbi:hypothetical protein [Sphingomonas pokkalii]|uniref:Uncharacterized protein n=1 Tax=Sphingomonas pokkalii TaxID=2175090 RepID=A0A2U0SI12_9SPHN|nr:hypothetical protein [Sphingomonas pokkalii]PVX30983.1 hypothetical protein DD559_17965 [Sphingomonas pokkalii]